VSAAGTALQLPSLPLTDWEPTKNALHLWSQIVGKIKLAITAPGNHWWNAALLRYDAVRTSTDPKATLLAFVQSAYEAGASLSGWDVGGLDSAWCPRPTAP
jgi:hypothetical protein